ncbi:MAG: hypothetical protein R2911_25580 [Caldilineaceae bacterium]
MTPENTERFVFPEWLRWVLGSVTFLAAAILILSIVLGIRAGQSQLELQSRQQIGISLQRALDYRSEGNLEAALEEYRRVLILDPNNTAAADGIEILLALASGQISPEAAAAQVGASNPAPAASVATAAPTNEAANATNPQFDQAQLAFESGRWEDAIALLEEMRQAGDASEQVNALLYNAYLSLGIEQERQDKFEPALSTLDKALGVRPGAPEAQTARNTIAAYLDVLTLSGADWEKAVATLEKLYALDAGYRDVRERLQRAHMQYGDALVADQNWCGAVSQYNAAIAIQVTPGSISKRDKYQALCDGSDTVAPEVGDTAAATVDATIAGNESAVNNAQTEANPAASTPTPQSAAPADEPVVSAPVVSGSPSGGRILYSAREPGSGRSLIFAQPVGSGGAPSVLVDDASQPAMRNDGARLAFHDLRADNIGLGSVDPGSGLRLRFTQFGEDSLPSWSHDGSRLVFASNREGDRLWRIYTVWAEENGAIQNLSFGESPDWHPTADLIAFRGCDERGNGCGIWTMTGNGGNRQSLTNIPADTRPDWAPDGSFVAFSSDARHGNPEIYRVNVSDGSVVRLTDSGAGDVDPTVSPDGAWVAFLSNRDGAWKIWAAPASGGEAQVVAPIAGDIGNWLEQNIQWIP